MNLDSTWKIAVLVGVLILLRVIWGVWKQAPSRKAMTELLDSGLIAFTLVFLLIRPFVVQAFFIPSGSMEPTLLPGDRILVNKFVYRLNPPQRGDIIVFDAPSYALQMKNQQADFVKRLIGLPGDRIHILADDGVYINGEKLVEAEGTYLPDYNWPRDIYSGAWTGKDYIVPSGKYFVLGDHRTNSHDSHQWVDDSGRAQPALNASRVLGKAMVIFWPPQRIRLLSDRAQVHTPADVKARVMKAKEPGVAHATP